MEYQKIKKWIEEKKPDVNIVEIKKISNGVSTNTYKIFSQNNNNLILKIIILNDYESIQKFRWQYDIQKELYNYFPVPKMIDYCSNKLIVGNQFYLMEESVGKNSNDSWCVDAGFSLFSDLHLLELNSFFKNKIKKNNNFYEKIQYTYSIFEKTKISDEIDLNIVKKWLENKIPKIEQNSICHNDWRMQNLLFHNKEVSAVLDWELSAVGDPRMDLGISMAYCSDFNDTEWSYISPEKSFKTKNISKKTIIDEYFNKTNLPYEDWKFFEIFGIFRLMVIGQLGGYRYKNGIIKNSFYRDMDKKIPIAYQRCMEIINNGK